MARPLIRFGIPLSVMGLLLKEGIDINLIKSAFLAFSIIGFLIVLINIFPIFKYFFTAPQQVNIALLNIY